LDRPSQKAFRREFKNEKKEKQILKNEVLTPLGTDFLPLALAFSIYNKQRHRYLRQGLRGSKLHKDNKGCGED